MHSFFHTGAFNAFDKDGDGIIKLNVLEVKPKDVVYSSCTWKLKVEEAVRQTGPTVCSSLSNGGGGMGEDRNIMGSSAGNVARGGCILGEDSKESLILKMILCWKTCNLLGRCCFLENLSSVWHAGDVPFPLPCKIPGAGPSFFVCILILGLPLSVAAAHHVCLNQAGLSQGHAGSLRISIHPYS